MVEGKSRFTACRTYSTGQFVSPCSVQNASGSSLQSPCPPPCGPVMARAEALAPSHVLYIRVIWPATLDAPPFPFGFTRLTSRHYAIAWPCSSAPLSSCLKISKGSVKLEVRESATQPQVTGCRRPRRRKRKPAIMKLSPIVGLPLAPASLAILPEHFYPFQLSLFASGPSPSSRSVFNPREETTARSRRQTSQRRAGGRPDCLFLSQVEAASGDNNS